MTVRVYVFPKATVLDPQGQAVRNALVSQGHQSVAQVRQGKVFDIELGSNDPAKAEGLLKSACEKLLANTVIENYRVEILG